MSSPTFECHVDPSKPTSPDFRVRVDGEDLYVSRLEVASVVRLSSQSALTFEIIPAFAFESVVVRPLAREIEPVVSEGVVRVALDSAGGDRARYVSVEFDDELSKPLFILVDPPETGKPNPDDPDVIYIASGTVHEQRDLVLRSGQTLYIAGGAVFRGNVAAREAENISIRGRGIIDGSLCTHETCGVKRLIHLTACDNVVIEGVTLFDGRNWQIVPAGCDGVSIRNVKIVSHWASDDGMDLVGSRDLVVDDCFIRTRDDCIAIKGFDTYHPRAGLPMSEILIRRIVVWNAEWGNALEIGYETRVDSISNVRFEDIDVIRSDAEYFGSGGVLTIHVGDRATVSNIVYDDIRVENAGHKLVDLKVLDDRSSKDDRRGTIHNVLFRNIRVLDGPFPLSILQGFRAECTVVGVTFEHIEILGARVRSAAEMRLLNERARDITFV